MTSTVTAQNLDGIIPPVITPLTQDGRLDPDAFKAEVDYVARFPIGGVLVGAATGEGYALETEETVELCRIASRALDGRVPVIAGVLAPSTPAAAARGAAAADAGADALMVTAATYFPAGLDSQRSHFQAVVDAAGLPVMIYNALPHHPLATATLAALARCSGIVAIKQGMGGTLPELRQLIEDVGESVSVMWSQDLLLFPGYCMGARGSLASIDGIIPDQTTALYDAVQRGDLTAARKLDATVSRVAATLGPTDWPAAVKFAIRAQGRPAGPARDPYQLDEQRQNHILDALRHAGIATE